MTEDTFFGRNKNQEGMSNSGELLINNSLDDLHRRVGRSQTISPRLGCFISLFCSVVMIGGMLLIVYMMDREYKSINSLGSRIFRPSLIFFIIIFLSFRIIDKSWREIKITNEGVYYRQSINSDFKFIEKKRIKNIGLIMEIRKIPISSERVSYRTTRITSQILPGIAIRVETAFFSINFPNCVLLSSNINSQAGLLNALTNKISLYYPIKTKGIRKGKIIIWAAALPVIVGLILFLL
jgi:hypothetical protein